MTPGLWYGLAAYAAWGLFPAYWKLLGHVPAPEILAHRIVWSFVTLAVLVAGVRRAGAGAVWPIPARVSALYTTAALLIGVNWLLYVWAVNAGHIVETSLGYFITPLVNVVLGVLVFRERLRPLQWAAVALATTGVLYLTGAYGTLPWIALGLAASFGAYGLVKKTAPLGSLEGLALETAILVIPAAIYLLALNRSGGGAFLHSDSSTTLLLVVTGVITIVPLLLFASAVRRVPLSVIGILQYIAPTIQLLIGVLIFREPFSRTQMIGFSCVWLAIAIFGIDGLRRRA